MTEACPEIETKLPCVAVSVFEALNRRLGHMWHVFSVSCDQNKLSSVLGTVYPKLQYPHGYGLSPACHLRGRLAHDIPPPSAGRQRGLVPWLHTEQVLGAESVCRPQRTAVLWLTVVPPLAAGVGELAVSWGGRRRQDTSYGS